MINFLTYRWLYLGISLLVLVPGIFSLVVWGLRPSIDFVGGTVIEIRKSEGVSNDQLQSALSEQQIEVDSVKEEQDRIVVRAKPVDRPAWEAVKTQLNGPLATDSAVATSGAVIEELRFETVGPVLGAELLQKTLVAAIIAIAGILTYVAWAFKNIRYGVSAVVALFHDVLVVVGVFSLLGHFYDVEVDALFVTAVLTTMSFSVHDTIVVFDRIRESLRRDRLPFDTTINKALTETMTRSINNSMTILFMLLSLILLGGDTIRWFVVALLVGTISGTYSSPFVATPLLWMLNRKREKHDER